MKQIYTSIEIHATSERVWQILTDFNSYPIWNPYIRKASGEIKEGKQIKIYTQPTGSQGLTFYPILLKVEPNHELRWRGTTFNPFLFSGDHIFQIEELDKERVLFIQKEDFTGILVPFVVWVINRRTKRGFEEMNQDLKVRAESKLLLK